HPQAHHHRFAVQRLLQKVVHAGVHGLPQIVTAGIDGREQHEIGVVRFAPSAHFLAQLQTIHAGHHPIAHDDPHWIVIEHLPCLVAARRDDDLMPVVLQSDLEDLHGYGIILGNQYLHRLGTAHSRSSASWTYLNSVSTTASSSAPRE